MTCSTLTRDSKVIPAIQKLCFHLQIKDNQCPNYEHLLLKMLVDRFKSILTLTFLSVVIPAVQNHRWHIISVRTTYITAYIFALQGFKY